MSKEKGAKSPKSTTERQAELKKRRADAGLVRFEIWATPEQKLKILEFAAGVVGKD